MSKTFFARLKRARSKHEAFTLKKARRKAQHRARVITRRVAAGKPPLATARNSRAYRAMMGSAGYGS